MKKTEAYIKRLVEVVEKYKKANPNAFWQNVLNQLKDSSCKI